MANRPKRQSFALKKRWLIILLIAGLLPMFSAAKDRSQPTGIKNEINAAAEEQKSLAAAKKATEQKPPIPQKKEELTITATKKDFAEGDIFIGIIEKEIINPRCLDTAIFIKNMPEIKEAEKERKGGSEGKYWILLSYANDHMHKQIEEYAKTQKITFLCKRDKLFALLRQREQYEKKSDRELIAAFDVTNEILEYFSKKNKNSKKRGDLYNMD